MCSEPRYAEPIRAKPKIGRPGGMPTISTVAQGGAQRSEQDLEARTGRGARADDRQPAQVLQSRHPLGVASLKENPRAVQRERAPQAQRRLSGSKTEGAASLTITYRFERRGS